MATLEGKKIKDTYKDLLKIASDSDNAGLDGDGTLRTIEDGDATASALQLSTAGIKSTGTLEVSGNATFDTNTLFVDATNNNVGIGTTSPSMSLDVRSTSSSTASFARADGSSTVKIQGISGSSVLGFGDGSAIGNPSTWAIGRKNSDNSFRINYNEDSLDTTNYLIVKTDGNVGIGTASPTGKLEIFSASDNQLKLDASGLYSSMYLSQSQSIKGAIWMNHGNLGMFVGTTVSNGYLIFATNNSSEKMRITSSGNVGIGTISPTHQLHLSTGDAAKATGTAWTEDSDSRIKKDIVDADLQRCLDIVKAIPLKHYGYKDGVYLDKSINDKSQLGWIAQEVEAVFPKAVQQNKLEYQEKIESTTEFEEYEEDIFIETEKEIVKEEIKLINGKYTKVIIKEIVKTKEKDFEEFDLFNENGKVIGKHKIYKKQLVSKPKMIPIETIDDCRSLNADQIYKAMFGALQLLIQKVEALEKK